MSKLDSPFGPKALSGRWKKAQGGDVVYCWIKSYRVFLSDLKASFCVGDVTFCSDLPIALQADHLEVKLN